MLLVPSPGRVAPPTLWLASMEVRVVENSLFAFKGAVSKVRVGKLLILPKVGQLSTAPL
jgi:hypothetical protein